MKHIDTYKLFESVEEDIRNTINDVLLDLTDEGFKVDIQIWQKGKVGIGIYIRKNNFLEEFKIKNMLPHIKELESHLEDYVLNQYQVDGRPMNPKTLLDDKLLEGRTSKVLSLIFLRDVPFYKKTFGIFESIKENKLFESNRFVDALYAKSDRLRRSYNKSVKDLIDDFKIKIDECMYDLTDTYETTPDFYSDGAYVYSYRMIINQNEFPINGVSRFETEFNSCVGKLKSIGIDEIGISINFVKGHKKYGGYHSRDCKSIINEIKRKRSAQVEVFDSVEVIITIR